jgi:hypothetical protein
VASESLRMGLEAEKRAADPLPAIESAKAAGAQSLRQIAARLNEQNITTPRGGEWSACLSNRMDPEIVKERALGVLPIQKKRDSLACAIYLRCRFRLGENRADQAVPHRSPGSSGAICSEMILRI